MMSTPTLVMSLVLFVLLAISQQSSALPSEHVKKMSEPEFTVWLEEKMPHNALMTNESKSRAMASMMRAKKIVEEHGCATHVCFALDAGVFVSEEEYNIEKGFVALVAAVAGLDTRFLATGVQYGLNRAPFSPLTPNIDNFLLDVDATSTNGPLTPKQRKALAGWHRDSKKSFKRSLRYCTRQVRSGNRSANKIIFLGDLRSPRGGLQVSYRFLDTGGAVCAIGFGRGRPNRLRKLQQFTSDPARVLGTDQFDEVVDILEETVKNACGVIA